MSLHLTFQDFVIAALAVWRLTHLLWGEDGPWDCFVRFRRLAGASTIGRVLDCFNCLSVWIAIPFACWIGASWPGRFIAWPALSGAAILLERITSRHNLSPAVAVWEKTDVSAPE
jgi:hypothetical protein